MDKRKYILKEGVVLKPYGVNSMINNTNLTDAMAEMFLDKGKAKKEDFIQIKKVKKSK